MSLSNLARMAKAHASLIAGTLAAYQQAHHLDDLHLAQLLTCSAEELVHLRLCQLPRQDHYDQDLARIADYVHTDAAALARVLNGETVKP